MDKEDFLDSLKWSARMLYGGAAGGIVYSALKAGSNLAFIIILLVGLAISIFVDLLIKWALEKNRKNHI